MAAGAGRSVDRVLAHHPDSAQPRFKPAPQMMMMERVAGAAAETPAAPGEIEVHAQVELIQLPEVARRTLHFQAMPAQSLTPDDYAKARRVLMRRDPALGTAIKAIGAVPDGRPPAARPSHRPHRLHCQPATVHEGRSHDLRALPGASRTVNFRRRRSWRSTSRRSGGSASAARRCATCATCVNGSWMDASCSTRSKRSTTRR